MKTKSFTFLLAVLLAAPIATLAEDPMPDHNTDGFTNTPIVPGTHWHVHDPNRPQPVIVTPGTFSTQDTVGKPPSDAVVLFNGTDVSEWRDQSGADAKWKVENGDLVESK